MSTPHEFVGSDGRKVTPDNAHEIKQDFVQVGQGCYRAVWDLGDAVIKFARYDGGKRSNRAEVRLWEEHKDTPNGAMLCPILAASPDGSWVIMVKAEPALEQEECGSYWEIDYSDSSSEALDFCKTVSDAFGLRDVHEGNVGWLEGRMVALDYAD